MFGQIYWFASQNSASDDEVPTPLRPSVMVRAVEILIETAEGPTESQNGFLQAFPEPSFRWLRINA
jgi:hypothetical protein